MEPTATTAQIVEVEIDGKKARVVPEPCPFHPAGGGQPGDTGTLEGNRFRAVVRDALKRKEDGRTVLELALKEGVPEPGMTVSASVDLARNKILSRMHTAQHIFSRLQENLCEGLATLKVNIGVEESVVHVRYDGEIGWDSLFELEEQTLEAIGRDLPVESFSTSREEAEKIPELKAKWERIRDEQIRIVRIAGLDATACSGTHAASTGEIGAFMVTGFNGSPPDWEIRFTVEAPTALRDHSRAMRRLLRLVGCRPDQLEEVFLRQKEENGALRQVLDKARSYIAIPWETRRVANRTLYFAMPSGLTRELLSAPARDCVAEHPDALCLVLLPGNDNAPFPFTLIRGAQITTDFSSFLKKFPELEARGGGKPDWINGTTAQRSVSVWLDAIARHLAEE